MMISRTRWWQLEFSPIESREHKDLLRATREQALLLARWLLDHNDVDGGQILPQDDRVIADLLVQTASGADAEKKIISILEARA